MDLVIYHADCLDGFCAAWVANMALKDAVFLPAKYGDWLPTELISHTDGTIYILDFSYPRAELLQLAQHNMVVVLDHHKTAEADLKDLVHPNLEINFDMNRSGAGLTRDYFLPIHENSFFVKDLVEAVQDRDLWKFETPFSEEVCLALSSISRTFDAWDAIPRSPFDLIIESGVAIKAYRDQMVEQIIKDKVRWLSIGGYYVPSVNTSMLQSEVCHRLLQIYKSAPFACSYYMSSDGTEIFSLRSENSRIDVSEVAKTYKGGGHRNAAGFKAFMGVAARPFSAQE